ncbi:MAG: hypothetical protein F6K41_00245 [Symploca sp. SIO3E6]|nr:hypothetical protein [Caldora sp. SIO3E6]
MPETIQFFLDRIKEAADVLRESTAIDLIEDVKSRTSTSKLQILIVGSTGSGRFSVANCILEQPDLLRTSPIAKAAIGVDINYGETVTVEVSAKKGIREAISIEKLKTFLTNPDTEASKYRGIEVMTNCDLLKTCQLRIESINAKRSDAEWKEVLAGTDYAILVLNAVALLSEQEVKFIKDTLQPNFGLERIAILLNQIDRVPEDERLSVSEQVRTFLWSLENQPPLIEFSATQASKAINSGSVTDNSGYAALSHLVKIDLVERHSLLKSAAMRQAAEICLTEVEEEAARQNALIATSETELQELLAQINSQSQWLESRIQRAQQKIEIFINTLIKDEFIVEIEGFSLALRQQLPDEVMPIKDITQLKRHLPGYLVAVWEEFLKYKVDVIKTKLIQQTEQISQTFENDLKQLLGDKVTNLQTLVNSFDSTSTSLKNFLPPKSSKTLVRPALTILQLGGLIMIVVAAFNPPANILLAYGGAAIGSGELLRKLRHREIGEADRQAILSSAIEEIQNKGKQIKQQVECQFDELTEKMKQATADLYKEQIDRIRSTLQDDIAYHRELVTKKEEIDKLVSVTLPELKQIVEQLG